MKKTNKKNKSGKELEIAVLGGGCFWCTETVFSHTRGVRSVLPGYAGGPASNASRSDAGWTNPDPTYEEVCGGKTDHAEVVKIEYDPAAINYEEIINIFLSTHDPTTLNRQGPDSGTQYRSVILYLNEEQRKIAQRIINELTEQKLYGEPIVTELRPLEKFYPAEGYHRNYFEKNPDQAYCQAIVTPKLAKFREKYKKYYV
jgi:peptide-methionine (S)-S-oxide reductase